MEIEQTVKQISKQLIDAYFEKNATISGKEILEFSTEKQINLFILYMLMQEWKENIEDIKTPFFDYENDEVKEALKSYMNVVSKHIKVAKNDFEPLLVNAVNYTLQLAKNPESFIVGNHLEPKLDEIKKYIVIHKPYFDGDNSYEVEDLSKDIVANFATEEKSTETIVSENLTDENNESINEKLADEEPKRIIDKFTSEEKIDNTVKLKKIENIKNAITINQRFVFINELFKGDNTQYDELIARLDDCNDYEQAKSTLANALPDNSESDSAQQLFLLIQQKYNFSAE